MKKIIFVSIIIFTSIILIVASFKQFIVGIHLHPFSNTKINTISFNFETSLRIKKAKTDKIKSITQYEIELDYNFYTYNEKIIFYEEYNKKGNIIKTQHFKDGTEIEKLEYLYDSNENILAYYFYEDGQLDSYSKYSYFDNKVLCEDYRSDNFYTFLYKTENSATLHRVNDLYYDKYNYLIRQIERDSRLLISDDKYIYDNNYNLIKIISKIRTTSLECWKYYYTWYEYDNNKNLTKKILADNEFKDSLFLEMREYSYDKSGNILFTNQMRENKKSELKEFYIYDIEKKLIRKYSIQESDSIFIKDKKYCVYFTYNNYHSIYYTFSTSSLDKIKHIIVKYTYY